VENKRGAVVRSVVLQNMTHRDPWVLYNLWKLSRELDPEGLAEKRQVIVRRIDDLNFQLRQPPTKGLAPAVLRQQEQSLLEQAKQIGSDPARDAERRRVQKALARVRVQIELGPCDADGAPADGPARAAEAPDDARLRSPTSTTASGPAPKLSDARGRRLTAATALTLPCVSALQGPADGGGEGGNANPRARFNISHASSGSEVRATTPPRRA
jgi:hypothetical protein